MLLNDKLKIMIEYDEGKKLKVYKCTQGFLTVGIGHNLQSDSAKEILGRTLKLNDVISEKECKLLFNKDFDNILKQTSKIEGYVDLQEKYKIVILSMIFQLGLLGTLSFKNTIDAMRKDNIQGVVFGIKNSKWYKQTSIRCNRLISIIKDEFVKEYGF